MSKQEVSLTYYSSQILIDKIRDQSSTPIFVLCDECIGVQFILVRPEYQQIINALIVVPTIAN
jgi:hypothetical protein